MNYSYLLRELLLKPNSCLDTKYLPKSNCQWLEFLQLAVQNRLTSYLYHFISCKRCSSLPSNNIIIEIRSLYAETLIRWSNYKKIRSEINKFIKKTSIPLILIKDSENDGIKGYPLFYIPLKKV